ncbi:type 1 glutamine amidotransferase [Jeotgalicoccus sp. FSL K6-3177]|uniref:type 1 glutamine amidotransferase n=1 Tax=Jeotgalicoccus sp. FSL K6-3177 TaxID=2921494 RepID=UPI0030FD8DEB
MKICFIQNDPIVVPGTILEWIEKNNHEVEIYKSYEEYNLPDTNDFDLAIILGGRMGAYEEKEYPALTKVKEWTKHNIDEDKHILGICLGAQIIADVTGGEAKPHDKPEVGWYNVEFNEKVNSHHLLKNNVSNSKFYEFHFDSVELPEKAILLGSSERTDNQIFAIGDKVLATQFHPEFNIKSIEDALNHTNEEKAKMYYAQSVEEMKNDTYVENSKKWLFNILDNFESSIKN